MKIKLGLIPAVIFCLSPFIFLSAQGVSNSSAIVNQPSVEVKNSQFYLDSKLVKMPVTAVDLEKIIGKPDRWFEGVQKVSTWDRLGIIGYQSSGSDNFVEIGIVFDIKENSFEFSPSHSFTGSFILDGVKITAASSLNSVNRRKKGAKFKPIPFVKILSEYQSGDIYLVMWQTEKAKVLGDAKILQIAVSKDGQPW